MGFSSFFSGWGKSIEGAWNKVKTTVSIAANKVKETASNALNTA